MEKKIIKPQQVIYDTIFCFFLGTYMFAFASLLILASGEIWGAIGFLLILLGLWIFLFIATFIMYHKDRIEITYGKMIIDQKVMEWENERRRTRKSGWIHQRMEINLADVSRIGCSYDLYRKYLYYHAGRTMLNVYEEVTVEMNDGRKITFDPSIYSRKQMREIISILSRNGEIQISGHLRKILG